MMPVIGITAAHVEEEINTYPRQFYVQAILKAGGLPLLLPVATDQAVIDAYLRTVDGVILSGGGDVDPFHFKQEPLRGTGHVYPERDQGELSLAGKALEQDLPILAICRGIQVLNIAAGGNILQDINGQVPGVLEHNQKAPRNRPWHSVTVQAGSRLAEICQGQELRVNSFHHQAVDRVAPGFEVTAKAQDGIIEAIEARSSKFALGVQWHPEAMLETDARALALFEGLIKACQAGK